MIAIYLVLECTHYESKFNKCVRMYNREAYAIVMKSKFSFIISFIRLLVSINKTAIKFKSLLQKC